VPEPADTMEDMARRVRSALASGDPADFAELLDDDVRWGAPGARVPSCRSRADVLAWYERGRAAGTRGEVIAVEVLGDRLLVELVVRGTEEARQRGGAALRWQILTVAGGRVVDIVGFDDRAEALAFPAASGA